MVRLELVGGPFDGEKVRVDPSGPEVDVPVPASWEASTWTSAVYRVEPGGGVATFRGYRR